MTSNYSSDPHVPPARVGHLGKHHRSPSQSSRGPAPSDGAPTASDADKGPTYDDFLEHESADDELPDKTG